MKSLDPRDSTKPPPAYLDPWRVLLSARAAKCAEEMWKADRDDWIRVRDWVSA